MRTSGDYVPRNVQQSSRMLGSGRSSRAVILLGRWFLGFRILAQVQSPKRQSYSNRNRAPTVMSCAVPREQDHGAVDGERDRHYSLDCSECWKLGIELHGPPVSQRRRMLLVS
jgi:hypothetical protein